MLNGPSELIKQFIVHNFLFGDEEALPRDDASLLERGIIDSVGVLDLVSFIEHEFRISIEEQDVTPDNFDSITSLSAYVCSKAVFEPSSAIVVDTPIL